MDGVAGSAHGRKEVVKLFLPCVEETYAVASGESHAKVAAQHTDCQTINSLLSRECGSEE